MICDADPRACDECRRRVDRRRMARSVTVCAHRGRIDHSGQYCPRCARALARRRRFGEFEPWARDAARLALEHAWGEPLQILYLQQGTHTWAVLCRPRPLRPIHQDQPPC